MVSRRLTLVSTFVVGAFLGFTASRRLDTPPAVLAQADRLETGSHSPEEQIRKLKLELPKVAKPVATYVPAVRIGDLLFVSGHGPRNDDGSYMVGRLGQDMDIKAGKAAARNVGLNILSTVRAELGSLDKVVRVVKTLGMVNSTPDFKMQPLVVNGFSDLMVDVFGDKAGKGARSAVGMAALPGGIPVEVEIIFQVK